MATELTALEFDHLSSKARWVWKETLKIHKIAQDTRVASSLSVVEILVALYYGKILKYEPNNPKCQNRDRFIISKGHGSISFYPILADLAFFDKSELEKVGKPGSFLGGIPDTTIPGYETTNGSLGHGLGVGSGIAIGLKQKRMNEMVVVLCGDGELNEGSMWEAIMFSGQQKLDNLILIVDNNKACMLDCCANVIDLSPLSEKFSAFRWDVQIINGHDFYQIVPALKNAMTSFNNKPKVIIAETNKGNGIPSLMNDPLSHIRNIDPAEVDRLLKEADRL